MQETHWKTSMLVSKLAITDLEIIKIEIGFLAQYNLSQNDPSCYSYNRSL